jgi:DNA-binding NarL/FixJ family response regulator
MPAVTVHALRQAEAALAAAGPRGVLLLSARGAAAFAGPGWFLALAQEAARRHPDVPCDVVLDCADAAGTALAALRAGARRIILDGTSPAFPAVAAAAAEAGAEVLPVRPPSLDLGRLDLRRRADAARLAAWLAGSLPGPADAAADP